MPYEVTLINAGHISFAGVKLHFYEGQCRVANMEKIKPQSLLPGEKVLYATDLTCCYRGEYPVGVSHIEITDFWYIFKVKWVVPWSLKLVVLPEIVVLDRISFLPELIDPKITGNMQKTESDMRDNEFRKYQNGDPLKAIHWKAVARQRQLITRKNEPQVKGENIIFLDLSPTLETGLHKLEVEDKMIEVALALGNYLMLHQIPGTLIYDDCGLKECIVNEEGAFGCFYDACGKLTFNGMALEEAMMALIEKQNRGGHFIVITHRLTEKALEHFLDERMRQNQLILIVIEKEDEMIEDYTLRQLEMSGIDIIELKCKEELKAKLEGSEQGK